MTASSVLIIRPGALGDALLTLPALQKIIDAGAASITILGTPASWKFLNPAGSFPLTVLDFASSEWLGLFSDSAPLSARAAAVLAANDLTIAYLSGDSRDVQRRLREHGARRVIAADAPQFSPSPPAEQYSSATPWHPADLPPQHATRLLSLPVENLSSTNAALPELSLELRATADEQFRAAEFLKHASRDFNARNFIALHPGSGGKHKCWPAEFFAQLAHLSWERLRLFPLIFFGPADDAVRKSFFSLSNLKPACIPVDNLPLREVFALLTRCRLAVCNDTGIAHLSARATRTLALFGPTRPAEWAPVGERVWTLQAPHNNLRALSVESVFAVCSQLHSTP